MEIKRQSFKIGTRGSALALWQSETVASLLKIPTKIVTIKTSGDQFQNIPLQGQSQTGFFTKEIENQLLHGEIDIAVHSLKDLPTKPHPDLELMAYLPRAAVCDLLLINPLWHNPDNVIPLKKGCKVGATSLRRQSLLRLYGPHTTPDMLRGNVPTRIKKCVEGRYGAIILAQAGVQRLKIDTQQLIIYQLKPEIWIPAPGQGVIAVQCRKNDKELSDHISRLDDKISRRAVTIERKLLEHFEGGCHTAFGSYAFPGNNSWNVFLGLDRENNKGWGQALIENRDFKDILKIIPSDIESFDQIHVKEQGDLCKHIFP